MSYQTTGELLAQAIHSAASNLAKGGLFVFDFWHTPGVLADPPSKRTRTVSDGVISARRTSVPNHDIENSLVSVDFSLEIEDKVTGAIEQIEIEISAATDGSLTATVALASAQDAALFSEASLADASTHLRQAIPIGSTDADFQTALADGTITLTGTIDKDPGAAGVTIDVTIFYR